MNDPRDEPTAADYASANAEKAQKVAEAAEKAARAVQSGFKLTLRQASNATIHTAQRLLRGHAARLPQVEVSYNNWQDNPKAKAFEEAADLLEVLIDPEVS